MLSIVALLATVATATISPAPVTAQSATLAGISLGQSTAQVRSKLGEPTAIQPLAAGELGLDYMLDGGGTRLLVTFSADQVVDIVALEWMAGKSTVVDPLGIKIGDPADRITQIRGEPDRNGEERLQYWMPNGIEWMYESEQDVPDPCHTSKGPFHVGVISVSSDEYGVSTHLISSQGAAGWTDHTLAGVSLGESRASVHQRLGQPTTSERSTGPDKNVYQIDNGDMMYVDYDKEGNVTEIDMFCTCNGKMRIPVDMYGVGLVDDLPTLLRLRGQPIEQHDVTVGPHVVTYAAGSDAKWTYLLDWGHITWITLKKN